MFCALLNDTGRCSNSQLPIISIKYAVVKFGDVIHTGVAQQAAWERHASMSFFHKSSRWLPQDKVAHRLVFPTHAVSSKQKPSLQEDVTDTRKAPVEVFVCHMFTVVCLSLFAIGVCMCHPGTCSAQL